MNKTILAALVAAGQLLQTKPATALTFNFNWASDADGLTLVDGGRITATGTLDIDIDNVGKGESFNADNIDNVNITVTDNVNNALMFSNDNVFFF